MIFHFVIISLNMICSEKSLNAAYSSIQLHRQDLPISYDYNTLHFYDNNSFKKDLNTYQPNNQYHVHLQQYGNVQYAPVILDPSEENLRTYYKTTVSSTSEPSLPEIGDTTETNNLQLEYDNKHIENRNNDNSDMIPLKYFGGYNVKVLPKANGIAFEDDQKVGQANDYYGYGDRGDRHTRTNFKSKMDQPYSNKMYVEHQKIRQLPRRPVVDPRNLYERYHNRKPIKQISVLPALENEKIQTDFNSYLVKAPRLDINIARAYKIAPENDKAQEIGLVKRIALDKHKHKFVTNIDALIQKKSFLYPLLY